MLLLFESDDECLIYDRAFMLESKGIVIHVGNEYRHGIGGGVSAALQLFVVLVEQYSDALKLLEDPNHVVKKVISKEEIIQVKAQFNHQADELFVKVLNAVAISVFAVIVFFVLRQMFAH